MDIETTPQGAETEFDLDLNSYDPLIALLEAIEQVNPAETDHAHDVTYQLRRSIELVAECGYDPESFKVTIEKRIGTIREMDGFTKGYEIALEVANAWLFDHLDTSNPADTGGQS